MLERGTILLFGNFNVTLTRGIQRIGVPAERLNFVDRALHEIAERTGPVNRITRAKLMSDIHCVAHPEGGVFANLRRFRRGTGGKDRVKESLGGYHGTLHSAFFECSSNLGDDLFLFG